VVRPSLRSVVRTGGPQRSGGLCSDGLTSVAGSDRNRRA
jgi:hypothetical protein